jgi:hypothetical protein
MTGQLVVNTSMLGVTGFRSDDLVIAALEHAIRLHLTRGGTMFLSAAGDPASGRQRVTLMLTPMTTALFSYTDLDADAHANPELSRLVEQYRRDIYLHGGITLGASDLELIQPLD